MWKGMGLCSLVLPLSGRFSMDSMKGLCLVVMLNDGGKINLSAVNLCYLPDSPENSTQILSIYVNPKHISNSVLCGILAADFWCPSKRDRRFQSSLYGGLLSLHRSPDRSTWICAHYWVDAELRRPVDTKESRGGHLGLGEVQDTAVDSANVPTPNTPTLQATLPSSSPFMSFPCLLASLPPQKVMLPTGGNTLTQCSSDGSSWHWESYLYHWHRAW